MRARAVTAAVSAAAVLTCAPAHALPTMIRLGYTDCASCHISPQGGGPLNAYGRGIDAAQSLSGGEVEPSPDTRLTQTCASTCRNRAHGRPSARARTSSGRG